MATTQTYKVLFNNVTVKSSPFLLSSTLGKLKKDALVEVIDITGLWARIKYNNKYGYVIILYLEKVKQIITGSITIKYLNIDTNVEVLQTVTKDNLYLNTYSYTAPTIENYTVIEPNTKSVTLTNSNPNQEIIFYYKENIIYGSVTVNYVDKSTNQSISKQKIYKDLNLGTYSYSAIDITGYKINGDSSKSVTLTNYAKDQSITFEYDKILGKVTVEYIDTDTKSSIATADVYSSLDISSYTYSAKSIDGYTLVGESSQTITLTYSNNEIILTFEYKKNITDDDIYVIDLKKYGISNDNTNSKETTKGINNAIEYATKNGYSKIKLPEGHYSIEVDTTQGTHIMPNTEQGWSWTHNQKGIIMENNTTLDLTNCILEMAPSQETHYSVITFSGCNNSTLIGGTLIGDRYTHDYGQRINDNGSCLETGGFDETTGLPTENTSQIRTINYIDTYKTNSLPNKFRILPLEGANFSTTDGGRCFVYCYDMNNNFLGTCHGGGWGGYLEEITLIENTKKIKISFWNENNLKSKYYITTLDLYYTLEWGSGIIFTDAQNCTVKNTKIIDFIGDCVGTNCPPCDYNNYNLQLIGCTLENSRRQGISLTGDSEIFVVKDCNIGYINGVDPQCGVDIETETGSARKILFDNCHFYMNKRADFDNFNGVDTEIKNCTFNGSIVSVYGNGLKVHDNIFEYKLLEPNKKNYHPICNSSGVGFSGKNNECYSNIAIGEKTGISMGIGNSNKIYNNIIKNGATLTTRVETYGNKYYNSNAQYGIEIEGDGTSTIIIHDEEYNNSHVQNMLTIKNSIFNDTDVYCQGGQNTSKIYNCELNFNTSQFLKITSGSTNFENCNFNIYYDNNKSFMPDLAGVRIFNNCNFSLGVTKLVGILYGKLIINNCTFTFNKNYGSTNNIDSFIVMGYTGSIELTNNKYYKSFEIPTILLPSQIGITVNNTQADNTELTI